MFKPEDEIFKKLREMYRPPVKIIDSMLLFEAYGKNNMTCEFIYGSGIDPRLTWFFLSYGENKENQIVKKYFKIEHAHKDFKESDILVCIEELQAYMIFKTEKDYGVFVDDLLSNLPNSKYTPYQIIFADQKQKMAFFIKGSDHDVSNTQKICKEMFGTDSIVKINGEKKEIVVQGYVKGLNESQIYIKDIQNKIKDGYHGISNKIEVELPTIEKISDGESYIKSLLSADDGEAAIALMKTVPSGVAQVFIINNTGCTINTNSYNNNINSNNTNCNNITINKNRKTYTKEWITNRKIKPFSQTKAVYEEYVEDIKSRDLSPFHQGMFNKFVEEKYNYKKGRDGNRKIIWIEQE